MVKSNDINEEENKEDNENKNNNNDQMNGFIPNLVWKSVSHHIGHVVYQEDAGGEWGGGRCTEILV